MTRIAIVGPGAVGGVLAAFLTKAGLRPVLIGRRARTIYVAGGPFKNVRLRAGTDKPSPCELVLFCVKSQDTAAAARRARPWIGPDTTIVSLQNGLTHRSALLSAFGKKRCVFGVCVIGAERTSPGRVLYHGGRSVGLGRRQDNTGRVERAAALLRRGGLEVSIDPSEDRLLWTKAVFNSVTNPLGGVAGATNGELISVPALNELALGVLKEAVSAARAAGHGVPYKPLERRLIAGMTAMPSQVNSTLQDLRAGRPTELDAIVKPLLDAARRRRVPTPLLSSLYRLTKRLERELA